VIVRVHLHHHFTPVAKGSDVNKDLTLKDKDQTLKDQTFKAKDQDKD